MTAVEQSEHGTTYPYSDGTGFIALPSATCVNCPSVGSTLCDAEFASAVFTTREDAVAALTLHAADGCPAWDEQPEPAWQRLAQL